MKRALAVLVCICILSGGLYVAASKWAIRHQTLDLFDATRQRAVSVDLAVRRDYEMKADDGYRRLPVALISNGNTVKNTEYSFLENVLAARGYLVASIEQDLPSDPPLVTKVGMPYVGRLDVYKRGEANILFVVGQLKKIQPHADYDHLTLVGHSNGGDITMYFARMYPDEIKKVVTLDNLRVPFMTDGKFKILSFRSKDPVFKTDPGVIPDAEQCEKAGITVVDTGFQHNDMRDTGPDKAKTSIETMLDKFLNSTDNSDIAPVPTKIPDVLANAPGPVALYAPVKN